mgnify:CR=1 FL=1
MCKIDKMKITYNSKLKILARNLRNNSTKSEIILWSYLKGSKMMNCKFSRQKPIDNYIADFFCNELKLVIELDGYTHQIDEVFFMNCNVIFIHRIYFHLLQQTESLVQNYHCLRP